jgi:hypothetical protein
MILTVYTVFSNHLSLVRKHLTSVRAVYSVLFAFSASDTSLVELRELLRTATHTNVRRQAHTTFVCS